MQDEQDCKYREELEFIAKENEDTKAADEDMREIFHQKLSELEERESAIKKIDQSKVVTDIMTNDEMVAHQK